MNKKNLEGSTTLGIAAKLRRERSSGATTEIEAILRRAGAFQRSSSPTHYSLAGFLKSPERRIEKIIKSSLFLEVFLNPNFFSMTTETRNAILVVAVLVATSTYQAILSPPGGVRGRVGGDNNNQLTTNTNGTLINATIISTTGLPTNVSLFNVTIFNPSATNTTYNPANQVLYHNFVFKKDFTYGDFFTLFYFLNTRCLVELICSFLVASWTGVVKYHGPRPSMRPKQETGQYESINIEIIFIAGKRTI
ncbi:unnamed protein product [Camellia sinensis]